MLLFGDPVQCTPVTMLECFKVFSVVGGPGDSRKWWLGPQRYSKCPPSRTTSATSINATTCNKLNACENNFDNPTSQISKKHAPRICHKMKGRLAYKSHALLQNKGTFTEGITYEARLLTHKLFQLPSDPNLSQGQTAFVPGTNWASNV